MSIKFNIRQILGLAFWIILGSGTVVLLVAAINKRNHKHCAGVDITITGVENNYFIEKEDVIKILQKVEPGAEGRALNSFDLSKLENELGKNEWIKKAELFFDNNEILKINVIEREPVARVITSTGRSFYIDTALTRLSLSDKFSARLPVFTNFPESKILSRSDIDLLRSIRNIGDFILRDSFWMAQIEQVDITANNTFEMIPKLGNQVIIFGDGNLYQEKFNNLLLFYKNVESRIGWNKYSKINVQYKNQVIGVRRGAQDVIQDSIRALQLMRDMLTTALKQTNDSLNNIQLVQPQDDNNIPPPDFGYGETDTDFDDAGTEPVKTEPIVNPVVTVKSSPEPLKNSPAKKIINKIKPSKPKPKAVMPKTNDY